VSDKTVAGYGGRLHDLTLYSPALYGEVHVDVLLPSGYRPGARRRYHVLYLLHGSGGHYTDWIDHGAAGLIAGGSRTAHLPPVITVMPDGGLEGFYSDWYGKDVDQPSEGPPPGWATFDLHELIPYIDGHYQTIASRTGRAIAGLSMGGFGATSLPARRPDLFSVAGSFSGADDTDFDYPYENELLSGTNPAFTDGAPDLCVFGDALTERVHWEAADPTYLAGNLAPVKLFLTSGNGTPGPYDSLAPADAGGTLAAAAVELDIWDMNQSLVTALNQSGVAHTDYFYGPGTHSWPYWERDLTHFLPFLAAGWAHPSSRPARFHYRSEASSFSVWGWSFTAHRQVAEFTYLRAVNREGLTATGSGTLHVTTAPLYPAHSRWLITIGSRRLRRRASRSGRLEFPVALGPSHTLQQTDFPSGAGAPAGWTSRQVRIARLKRSRT
jgi:S-formylglutathione hydrolase FrmB